MILTNSETDPFLQMKLTRNFPLILFTCLLISGCQFNSEKKQKYSAISKSKINGDQKDPLTESIQRGEAIYMDFCVTCHQTDGQGVKGSFPPLANSDYLREQREESIRSVKYGQKGEITVNGVTYNGVMAPMGLEDDEVADVMNYIMNAWGNSESKMVTAEEVSEVKK